MNKFKLIPFLACLVLIATHGCSKEESPEPAPAAERESQPAPKPAATDPSETAAAPSDNLAAMQPSGLIDVARRDMINLGGVNFKTANCIKCHGDGGTGTDKAPNLTDDEWLHADGSLESIRAVIVAGIPKDQIKDPNREFGMMPIGRFIKDEKIIDALALYVHSLSQDGS